MTTAERTLTGPRASSLVICERRAVYEALDAPREPTDPRMERIFKRGRRLGTMLAQEIADGMAAEGRVAEVEREVPWPHISPVGVGHADVFIPDDAHTIEIVSTAGCELPSHKARQAAFYSFYDIDSTAATVLSIDYSTNEERAYPVDVGGLQDEIEESVDRFLHGVNGGQLPRRAIRPDGYQVESPSEWPCFDCPFRRACWANYEAEPPGQLPEDLHASVIELADLEDRIARAAKLTGFEARRDELRAQLGGRMRNGGRYRAPGIKSVHRTEVAGRRTFGLKAFEDAGHVLSPAAQEFVATGRGHDRWYFTREEAPSR